MPLLNFGMKYYICEALSDVVKRNNPLDLKRSVTNQNGFSVIHIAYNQGKQKITDYSKILNKNKNNGISFNLNAI